MPNSQALQFAYGSAPVILLLLGILIQNIRQGKKEELLLTDILKRLGSIETKMGNLDTRLSRVEGHLHIKPELING